MTRGKAVAIAALSLLLTGIVVHRLYGWFTTGTLSVSSRFNPGGRDVSFASDPVGFVLGFGYDAFAILLALVLLLTVLVAE